MKNRCRFLRWEKSKSVCYECYYVISIIIMKGDYKPEKFETCHPGNFSKSFPIPQSSAEAIVLPKATPSWGVDVCQRQCMNIRVSVHLWGCVWMCLWVILCMRVWICECVYEYISVCMYVYRWPFVSVGVNVCMCRCKRMCCAREHVCVCKIASALGKGIWVFTRAEWENSQVHKLLSQMK